MNTINNAFEKWVLGIFYYSVQWDEIIEYSKKKLVLKSWNLSSTAMPSNFILLNVLKLYAFKNCWVCKKEYWYTVFQNKYVKTKIPH